MNEDPLADAPSELQKYFANAWALRAESLGINPMSLDAARACTTSIRQTSLGAELGLIALEDADNSMPYCYITRGAAAGMILQFNRADGRSLRYPSLNAFMLALKRAKESGVHIEDMPPDPPTLADNQASLSVRLLEALGKEPRDAEAQIEILLPRLDPGNIDVLRTLSESGNFLIREAVAIFIDRSPRVEHEEIARRLASDRYGQVARPAASAAKTIRRMKWELRRDAG